MSTKTMHKLTFTDPGLFRTLYEGFVIGGATLVARAMQNRQEVGFEERRAEARVLRKLKAISTPETDENGKALVFRQTGAPVMVLKTGEHEVRLTTDEHTKLKDFVKACPWDTARMDEAEDLVDFVLRASEVPAEP